MQAEFKHISICKYTNWCTELVKFHHFLFWNWFPTKLRRILFLESLWKHNVWIGVGWEKWGYMSIYWVLLNPWEQAILRGSQDTRFFKKCSNMIYNAMLLNNYGWMNSNFSEPRFHAFSQRLLIVRCA